ncbi:hypothetical protein [Xanthomonas albilineans]|uniref:hypothetical protein n=1 Tax=Xanthomonas albilineans TaxID=29447 RepID=UPI0012D39937|nr:hypothetical protein [Xanthomonas albilineans]QHQ27572.1 hypothetical protein XaFJ1_GM000821 [Xanthomonas albilineans]
MVGLPTHHRFRACSASDRLLPLRDATALIAQADVIGEAQSRRDGHHQPNGDFIYNG